MNLISPKIFGTLSLFTLIIILPTIILFTQKRTNQEQHAVNTTCSGTGYFCSETSCLDQHATFDTSKTCPQNYHNTAPHTQVCCKKAPTPTP